MLYLNLETCKAYLRKDQYKLAYYGIGMECFITMARPMIEGYSDLKGSFREFFNATRETT